jgi:hypothetical protein
MLERLEQLHGSGRRYSPNLSKEDIQIAAEGIKIVDEVESDGEFQFAKQLVDTAEDIAFLGFGYLQTNLERLQAFPSADPTDGRRWFGSAFGLGDGERGILS